MPGRALGFDRARHLDGATEQQQLFGQRGFTRIRMRNDRECTPAGDFLLKF